MVDHAYCTGTIGIFETRKDGEESKRIKRQHAGVKILTKVEDGVHQQRLHGVILRELESKLGYRPEILNPPMVNRSDKRIRKEWYCHIKMPKDGSEPVEGLRVVKGLRCRVGSCEEGHPPTYCPSLSSLRNHVSKHHPKNVTVIAADKGLLFDTGIDIQTFLAFDVHYRVWLSVSPKKTPAALTESRTPILSLDEILLKKTKAAGLAAPANANYNSVGIEPFYRSVGYPAFWNGIDQTVRTMLLASTVASTSSARKDKRLQQAVTEYYLAICDHIRTKGSLPLLGLLIRGVYVFVYS
jgi:hypothetical protein